MEIKINGKQTIFENCKNLEDIISSEGVEQDGLVVLLNDNIISKDNWKKQPVTEADEIEFICFVSGG